MGVAAADAVDSINGVKTLTGALRVIGAAESSTSTPPLCPESDDGEPSPEDCFGPLEIEIPSDVGFLYTLMDLVDDVYDKGDIGSGES